MAELRLMHGGVQRVIQPWLSLLTGGVGRLAWQLQKDCQLLEELRVMDYSLLLGLHFRSPDYGSTPHADRVSC